MLAREFGLAATISPVGVADPPVTAAVDPAAATELAVLPAAGCPLMTEVTAGFAPPNPPNRPSRLPHLPVVTSSTSVPTPPPPKRSNMPVPNLSPSCVHLFDGDSTDLPSPKKSSAPLYRVVAADPSVLAPQFASQPIVCWPHCAVAAAGSAARPAPIRPNRPGIPRNGSGFAAAAAALPGPGVASAPALPPGPGVASAPLLPPRFPRTFCVPAMSADMMPPPLSGDGPVGPSGSPV